MADLFDQHAYAMRGLRAQAEGIVAAAQKGGYTVDTAAVTITAPASAYMGGNLDRTGRETGALLNDLRTVVEYARAQDDAAAGIIAGTAPSGPGGFGGSPPGAISRAQELANKIKNPSYESTAAELAEFRDLVELYGSDRAFAYTLLDNLGPQGLLRLNGTLATYQNDNPGTDADGLTFSGGTADTVRALQNGLGVMLSTATTRTGTTTGPHGEHYVPGANELSTQWTIDLMAAGRSTMDIGDPHNPLRTAQGVHGYQLLAPLLRNGAYDAGFLATVGGDMVDFEMSQGGSEVWSRSGENVRLDWTRNHDDNAAPAGFDPMHGLVDALSRNGEATRDLLTGVTTYTSDGPAGGRLSRLDYLLTDREWGPDVPGGPGWATAEQALGEGYENDTMDKLGTALERATTGEPGPEARRLFEAIIYEANVDEQAKDEQPVLIHPQLRDSMATITAAYIGDVNLNIADGDHAVPGKTIDVDRTDLARFLADIGRDETAHGIVANAQAVYTASSYDEILSGRRDPADDIDGKLRAMGVVSQQYGSVMGALDYGATEAGHAASAESDEQHNKSVEDRYKVVNFLVDQVMGKALEKVPVPVVGDLAGEYVSSVLTGLEEQAKVDNSGQAVYDIGNTLGDGRATAADLTELALYNSGKLADLPERLLVNGDPKPVSQWTEADLEAWQRYKSGNGQDSVGQAAGDAGEAYQSGLEWMKDIYRR